MVNQHLISSLMLFLLLPLFVVGCSSVRIEENKILKDGDFQVKYSEYHPKKDKFKRGVVIVPPTGGVNYIDKRYAKGLASRGIPVKLIYDWTQGKPQGIELSLHQDFHSRAVRAIQMTAESFSKEKEVSLLGTSVGGLFSTIAASRVDRLSRVLVVGAGLSIPEVIVSSDQQAMADLKNQRFEKFGFKTDAAYLQALSAEFHIDPTTLPPKFESKSLGVILITEDKTVPVKTQRQLQKLWDPELLIEIDAGHFWGIVRSWLFHQGKIEEFLAPELR